MIECELVLTPMLPAAVVLELAMQFPVRVVWLVFSLLVMLWVLLLAIQRMVVLAHLFLCVLAYYVEGHMCQRLPSVVVVRG
ncbi:hypothetical protein E5S67_02400 [Microcoleus sp. IPMA8]|uniref:Uncharacterized protein n=1 Tax=Microcoleus asticus IPMA8 TaxID=2563858 RepID=A0ABX2CW82_9CYAN|nr:hypothetical protein [Microcoleus asticus IPMA8]